MVIVAKKLHKGRLLAVLAILALGLGIVGTGFSLAKDIQTFAGIEYIKLRNNAERVAYLEGLGWQVETEPVSTESIRIPDTFDSSYDSYLALQEEQGFHIEDYAGKIVKRYTYKVLNYPDIPENVWVSLLQDKKLLIGGEVFSPEGDGFTQSLIFAS